MIRTKFYDEKLMWNIVELIKITIWENPTQTQQKKINNNVLHDSLVYYQQ